MQTTVLLHYLQGVQSASKLSSITTFTTITGQRKLVSQIHIKLLQMIQSVLQHYMFPIILIWTA